MNQPEPRLAPSSHRIVGLDILRALAVMLVLGRHMWTPPSHLSRPLGWFFHTWQCGGWIGVDLFFVLSGFLVSGLLFAEYRKRGRFSVLRFYVRRGWKIYPAFLCFIGIAVLLNVTTGKRLDLSRVLSELFFLQNYVRPIFNHTWTLAVEEHFYLALPLLLAGLLRFRRGSDDPFRPIVFIVAFTGAALLVLRVGNAWSGDFTARTHLIPTHLRLDSLLFGVAISYAYHFHRDWFEGVFRARRRWLAAGGCMALLPAFVLPLEESPFIYTAGFTLFYVGSGALLTGVLLSECPRNRLAAGLGLIGSYSYSIYLWHVTMLTWGVPVLERLTSPGAEFHFVARVLVYVLGSVGVGVIMAHWVEAPALRMRDRWFPSRSGPLSVGHAPSGTVAIRRAHVDLRTPGVETRVGTV